VSFLTDDDPIPKRHVTAPSAVEWPVERWIRLPQILRPPADDAASVMERRRSVRRMQPASLREIVNVIGWVVARSRKSVHHTIPRSKALAASAGGLQAVEPILVPRLGARGFRFDGHSAQLAILRIEHPPKMESFRKQVREMAPHACECHAVIFVANMALAHACYERAESLVLRDAGVLQQTIHIAAEAFRLAALPLGILGRDACSAILPLNGGAEGVGVMLLGRHTVD
jgi:hypothetical protein